MLRPPPPELLASAWAPVIDAYLRALFFALVGLRIKPSSWFRDPQENRAEGGDEESQHLFAIASDWVGSDDALRQANWRARRVGLIPVPEPGHLHIQLFPRGALARLGVTFPT